MRASVEVDSAGGGPAGIAQNAIEAAAVTASAAVASLGAVLASGLLLGLELWVVAITALGYVVSRQTITAGLLARVAAALVASAIVYVAAVMGLGRLAQLF